MGSGADADIAAQVAVQVFGEFEGAVSEEWLGEVCRCALAHEGIGRQVSLVIADDATLSALNGEYRGVGKTTDVLAFALDAANQGEYYGDKAGDAPPDDGLADGEFVLPPDVVDALGEVIISYPQAERQARAAGHTIERELAGLITHGILHLTGHDHMRDDDEAAMSAKERAILARICGDNGEYSENGEQDEQQERRMK